MKIEIHDSWQCQKCGHWYPAENEAHNCSENRLNDLIKKRTKKIVRNVILSGIGINIFTIMLLTIIYLVSFNGELVKLNTMATSMLVTGEEQAKQNLTVTTALYGQSYRIPSELTVQMTDFDTNFYGAILKKYDYLSYFKKQNKSR